MPIAARASVNERPPLGYAPLRTDAGIAPVVDPTALASAANAITLVRRRYDRIARAYELLAALDLFFTSHWRRDLWSKVEGARVLEVGVGSGVNLTFHPPDARVTAIDIATRMLEAAQRRAARLGAAVDFMLADVQALPFEPRSFDTAIATFVFCSVPDPVRGLEEVRRVVRPGGRLLLLEHVVSSHLWLAGLMRALDPVTARLSGAHIARDTVENVRRAGFEDVVARPVCSDMVKIIEARVPKQFG